jgi:hypothetical protein
LICRKYNCLFVHIPKAAGQSIEVFFLDLVGRTGETREALLLRRNWELDRGPHRLSHLTASEYVNCGYLDLPEFNSLFKFSFVRNPWDRLVSAYEFWRAVRKIKAPDFKSFLFKYLPKANDGDSSRHVIPQYQFLCDENGKLLVDFIGRFESLQTDFDAVCKNLNITEHSTTLPHRNRAIGRRHYAEYYDGESLDFVKTLYKRDIELFNYTFD